MNKRFGIGLCLVLALSAVSAWAVELPVPGLKQYRLKFSGSLYFTPDNWKNYWDKADPVIVPGALMAKKANMNGTTWQGVSYPFGNYSGYWYEGYVKLTAGKKYSVKSAFDDGGCVYIDGKMVYQQGTSSGYNGAAPSFTPTPFDCTKTDWYPIQIGMWDWGGARNIFSGTFAVVQWSDGDPATVVTDYSDTTNWHEYWDAKADDVTPHGSYLYTGKPSTEGINVSGDPFEIAAPSPNYGAFTNVVVGQSYTFTCPAAWTNEGKTIGAVCKGYRLTLPNGTEISGSQTSTSIVFSAEVAGAFLEWQWDLRYLVTAVAKGGGSVTNALEWVAYGEKFNSRAVADEGRTFRKWTNASGTTIGTDADLAIKVTSPLTNTAYFSGSVAYVTTNTAKQAVYPYATWDTAAHDLGTALAAGSDEIEVGEGTYNNTVTYYKLDRAVKVYSSKGPSKTIIKAKSDNGGQIWITHANASISGLTFKNAYANDWLAPSALKMTAGIISNCVFNGTIKNSYSSICHLEGSAKAYDCDFDGSGFTGGSGWDSSWAMVWLTGNAVVDRCRVHGWTTWSTFKFSDKGFHKCAVVLDSANAVLRNSLVYGNNHGKAGESANVNLSGGGIILRNGTIENCTVAGNHSCGYGGGIYAENSTGTIRNCIVWGNATQQAAGADIYAPNLPAANLTYTCSGAIEDDASLPKGSGTGCTTLDPKFAGSGSHPYALTLDSVGCIDNGVATTASQAEGAKDVMGNPRLDWKNELIDIGCYEYVPSKEKVPLSASINVSIPEGYGDRQVSLMATPLGDDTSDLTFCWNFGDGESSAESLNLQHLYKPGSYTLSLALTNGVGEATNVVCETKIVIVPETCYVSKTGKGIYPYDTWEKATNDVAVALGVKSAEVVVGDGTFENTVYEHYISHAVNLHSLNGPKATTLKPRSSGTGRHFTVENNAATAKTVISGFTMNGGNGGFNTYSWFSLSAGVISNCVMRGSFRTWYGWCCQLSGSARAVDCEFNGSDAGSISVPVDGSCGLLYLNTGAVADRCVFHGYHAYSGTDCSSHNRTAVHVNGGTLRNSLVYDCSLGNGSVVANLSGGGVRLDSGNVVNCTVTGCTSWGNGGGIWVNGNNGYVRNCIVWGNVQKGGAGKDIYAKGRTNGNVLYTCASDVGDENAIPTTAQGAGCLAKDPLLRNVAKRDYRIRAASPCLDAGDPTSYPDKTGLYDIRGLSRKEHKAVDMGCYELKLKGFMLLMK